MTNSPLKCFWLSRRFRGKVGADNGLDAPDSGLDTPDSGLDTPDNGLDAADNDLESVVMSEGMSLAGLRVGVTLRRLTTPSSATAEAGAAPARWGKGGGRKQEP